MIERGYHTFSSSRADDQAFFALGDVARVTHDLEDARVVGGLMVSLLMEAYPTPGFVIRRTADVDTAISADIASSGTLHQRLVEVGYAPSNGNRYTYNARTIDLLVPSDTARFSTEQYGGRGFDSVPGLALALAGQPLLHHLNVTLSDDSSLSVDVRTPLVEHAVVLKALATRTRNVAKDLVDLHNLLLIAEQHTPEEIGGWRLGVHELRGARLDAARQLHSLRKMPGLWAMLEDTGVAPPTLDQLIRSKISI